MDFWGAKEPTPQEWSEIERYLKVGNKVKAVSEYRRFTNCSAERALEQITQRMREKPRGKGGMEFF